MTGSWGKSSHSQWSNCLEARWAKSSYSACNGNCLTARWHKARASVNNGACLQARVILHWLTFWRRPRVVQVRDSKLGEASPILEFSPGAWMEFIEGVKADRELAQVLGE